MKSLARILSILISFSIIFFALNSAFAGKEVSGGNGVGGTLLDRKTQEAGVRFDGENLLAILVGEKTAIFKEFPLLLAASRHYLTGTNAKAWYAESRELHPDCRNRVTTDQQQDIWACQNDVEIRINADVYLKLSPSVRADLILHEILTALRLSEGKTETVPAAFAVLDDAALSLSQKQVEFDRLGFAPLVSAGEYDFALKAVANFSAQVCENRSENEVMIALIDATLAVQRSLATGSAAFVNQVLEDVSSPSSLYRGRGGCDYAKGGERRMIQATFRRLYLK